MQIPTEHITPKTTYPNSSRGDVQNILATGRRTSSPTSSTSCSPRHLNVTTYDSKDCIKQQLTRPTIINTLEEFEELIELRKKPKYENLVITNLVITGSTFEILELLAIEQNAKSFKERLTINEKVEGTLVIPPLSIRKLVINNSNLSEIQIDGDSIQSITIIQNPDDPCKTTKLTLGELKIHKLLVDSHSEILLNLKSNSIPQKIEIKASQITRTIDGMNKNVFSPETSGRVIWTHNLEADNIEDETTLPLPQELQDSYNRFVASFFATNQIVINNNKDLILLQHAITQNVILMNNILSIDAPNAAPELRSEIEQFVSNNGSNKITINTNTAIHKANSDNQYHPHVLTAGLTTLGTLDQGFRRLFPYIILCLALYNFMNKEQ